ncbi:MULTISPECIES: hypothetical protein [Pseudoalteromonas]|uniref:Bacteriocin n=1 Tax=Pseudoalteromonas obscura TaxID=3048491 RepID=A0ABT7EE80_9GAMM|nr:MULTISPECIES: hypothetical protein [Pseudoalteromonas]MBQ4838535.1 hypothetical protein [Pseudoalteromonas luteoviolacea]MDK2593579.1 hypothetical protein [Pseudoalteromonas sp. P94(2023)]
MKLHLNKKNLKNLCNKKVVDSEQTPLIAGGGSAIPPTRVQKGCPYFSYFPVNTCYPR